MGLGLREGIRGLQELPQPLPRHPSFSGWALPKEHFPVGFQSLPCTLMPVSPSHGRLGACGVGCLPLGEGGTLILAILCRPALFSPPAHPGEQGGWERRGRALEGWKGIA